MNTLFPIFVKLEQLQVLLVGAGPVGLEKLQALFRNAPKANVLIVAEHIIPEVTAYIADTVNVHFASRPFSVTDLEGKDLVVVPSNNRSSKEEIRNIAK